MNGIGGLLKINTTELKILTWSQSPKKSIYDYKQIGETYTNRDPGMFDGGEIKIKVRADTSDTIQDLLATEFQSGSSALHTAELYVTAYARWKVQGYIAGFDSNYSGDEQYTIDITLAQTGAILLTPWDVPVAPSSIVATDTGGDVTITWANTGALPITYDLYYKTGCAGTENQAAILAGTKFAGTINPAGTVITCSGTKIGFIIRGVNDSGNGAYCAVQFKDIA